MTRKGDRWPLPRTTPTDHHGYQREYKWKQKQVVELIDDLAKKFLESHEVDNDRAAVADYHPAGLSLLRRSVYSYRVIRNVIGVALAVGAVTASCGSGGDSGPRGMQCSEVLQVYCNRAADPCQIIPTGQAVKNCINAGVANCCGGDCGASVISTQAEIDTCIADIEAASCTSLDIYTGGSVPPSCIGVVQSGLVVSGGASGLTSPSTDVASHVGQLISR